MHLETSLYTVQGSLGIERASPRYEMERMLQVTHQNSRMAAVELSNKAAKTADGGEVG